MSVRVNKLLMSYKITIAEALERSALKPLVRKVQIYCCFLSDKKDKFIFFCGKYLSKNCVPITLLPLTMTFLKNLPFVQMKNILEIIAYSFLRYT